MKLLHHPVLPIFQLTSNASKSQYFHTTSLFTSREAAICSELLNIINFVNPMEPALENVAPFLYPEIITSVLHQQRNVELGFRFFIWTAKRKKLLSRDSHNFVVSMLVKDNGIDLYVKTLEELKSSGISMYPAVFVVLFQAYGELEMVEKAVEAFSRMKDFDCKPTLFTYNTILHLLVKKNVIFLALAVYNTILKKNCGPNCSTFNILINGLCKSGKTNDALKLFDEMTQKGVLPTEVTYTVILSGLCEANKIDDAYKLFNSMNSRGCSPDVITYNVMLNGFCKLGKVDEAFMLARSFEKEGYALGIDGYSCLIDALVRDKRIDEAHDLFKKVSELNITPDLILYTIMIRGFCKMGRVQDALKLLKDMTLRGVLPDTQCYNTMIKGFCDVGLLDQARSLQLEISKNDCFPDTNTYSILICGLCRKGLVGDAEKIFNDMEKLGCSPSVATFNALIDGLCKAGKLKEAHLMFHKMEIGKNPSLFLRLSQGSERVLDSADLQTMVERLCDSGLILKAYKLLAQLADLVLPNLITYNILINGLCKAGNVNGAFKLFKEIQLKGHSPDRVTYATLIDVSKGPTRMRKPLKYLSK